MNKFVSLIFVLGLYVFAFLGAVGVAFGLNGYIGSRIVLLLVADVAATVIVFLYAMLIKNSSMYDPYWSVAPPCLMLGYYIFGEVRFDVTHLLVIVPVLVWSIRLTFNWARGFDNLRWQDWRYLDLKQKYPKIFPLVSFLGIMLMPTLLVFAGTIPFYYIVLAEPNVLFGILGGIIILSATAIQLISDEQMYAFRRDPANADKNIDVGLWRYSRHPNYFGEIMIWWGIFVCSLGSFSILSLAGCVSITALFVFVSVPMMEKHILQKRSHYAEYVQRVKSPLVPIWFWKAEDSETTEKLSV